mgnify:FL=1
MSDQPQRIGLYNPTTPYERTLAPNICPLCKEFPLQFVSSQQIEMVATLFDLLSIEKYSKCVQLYQEGSMAIVYCAGCGYFESLFPLSLAPLWYQAFKETIV